MNFEKLAYLALKNRLLTGDPLGLKAVDWYTNQQINADNGQTILTPSLLIEFVPVLWRGAAERIQQATINFRTYLVLDRDTDRTSDDPAHVANMADLDTNQAVYERLQGWCYSYSAGGQSYMLMNSISRVGHQVDHTPSQRTVHITTWRTFCRDYTAHPTFLKQSLAPAIVAELTIPTP